VKKTVAIALAGLMLSSTAPLFAQGADLYKSKCAMCHAPDGTASGPAGKAMKVPSFKGSKLTEAEITAITNNGKGKMPAYKGKLTDAQIKDVVAFVHTLQK